MDGCDDVEEMLRAIARLTVVVAHRSGTRRSRQSAWSGLSCEKMTRGARRRKREEKDEMDLDSVLRSDIPLLGLFPIGLEFLWNFCGIFAYRPDGYSGWGTRRKHIAHNVALCSLM